MEISTERQYVIVNNEHDGILRGALLFWGEITPDESPRRSFGGYTQDMNKCERYTLQEALSNHKYPVYGEDCDNENYRYLEDFLIRIDQLDELGYKPRLVYVRG